MRFLQFSLILALSSTSLAAPHLNDDLPIAQPCDPAACKLPHCRCAGTDIPGGIELSKTPQFVFLTYDDAVRTDNHDLYSQLLYNKVNPDGCNISATAFVSHQYTEYPKVHDLYEHGIEIALHSITHLSNTTYWQTATVDELNKEFGGEKQLISKFAKIPIEEFTGMRVPFLQLSGNNSFESAKELGIEYDCSWPTSRYVGPGLWPYTLDYQSKQDCPIGPCPTASLPGQWVVPMLDWRDQKDVPCAMIDQCVNIPTDAGEILEWIISNFNRSYTGNDANKAPFGFYIHATWFLSNAEHLKAYSAFIDYLQSLPDVYIVNISRALEWIRNPVPIGDSAWPACPEVKPDECKDLACPYKDQYGTEMYMHMCDLPDGCPPHYPSVDNPLGQ